MLEIFYNTRMPNNTKQQQHVLTNLWRIDSSVLINWKVHFEFESCRVSYCISKSQCSKVSKGANIRNRYNQVP